MTVSKQIASLCVLAIGFISFTTQTFAAEAARTDDRPVLRIGYIERSFSPAERQGIEETFDHLRQTLPQYRFTVQNYLVKDLERAIRQNEIEFFLGGSGFYRRVYNRGLRDLATMTTPRAPDPNLGAGAVLMVKKDSPYKTLEDLKGKRAAVNWPHGWTGVYIPQGELAKRGLDYDNYFEYVVGGSPMKRLLMAVDDGRADVAMSRACTLEELQETEPEFAAKFRPIALKPDVPGFACLHSTDLYPNWTFVSTAVAPWQASSAVSAALLTMPATADGIDWAVVSDFSSVDRLYESIKRGPYEYLRINTIGDWLKKYWYVPAFLLLIVAGLLLHGWRAERLVRRRTAELHASMKKEHDANAKIETLERISTVGAVSSLITHELNGPLSTISNACAAMERSFEQTEPAANVRKTVELIERQCTRASNIVNHVRNYVKHRENEIAPIELKQAVGKIVSVRQMKHPKVKIRFEAAGPTYICWNTLELELCVTNLIKNAAEALAETKNPEILVSVSTDEAKFAIISVHDNAATAVENLKVLTRPLNSTKTEGLGLGLLIVRTLVEKASGNFSIAREGSRTVARIRLPLVAPDSTVNPVA